ncbi:MAG: histidine kinase [Fibrobacteres bacterium]|nr:histidine kinase [Fibrobacterota bacterium]
MMTSEKLTTGMSYIALGAFAAYLGLWWSESGSRSHMVPMLIALGMAVVGLALLLRSGKRFARGSRLRHGAAFETRLESEGNPADRSQENERHGDDGPNGEAALFGHEMKNYLCTLKGNASLLRERIQDNDRVIIDRIDRVVERLESFTRNISKASNATSNRTLWRLRLGEEAKACVSTHFHRDTARFHWEIQDKSATLLGDPARFDQVFLNLYMNAVEAGARCVTTSVGRLGDRVLVRIEDDGKGCDPEDLSRIFEPFFTTKRGPARRGLGMFIVQSIVENHGGTIQVRSKNGSGEGAHGLVFTMDFPLSVPSLPEKPEAAFRLEPHADAAQHWLLTLPEPI